jgi:hypothetical protein
MCERWLNSFENFLADMGTKPRGLTLERRDVNGPYAPDNCEWATQKTQTRNRRITISVTYQGRTQLLIEWCDELGLDYYSVHRRLRREGRSPEDAFRLARRTQESANFKTNVPEAVKLAWGIEAPVLS